MRRSVVLPVVGLCIAFHASPVGAVDVFSLLIKRATKYQAEQPTTREADPLAYYEPKVAAPDSSSRDASPEEVQPVRKFFDNEFDYRVNLRRFEARYAFGGTAIRARFGFKGETQLEFRWPYLVNNGELKFSIAEDDGKSACQLLFVLAF